MATSATGLESRDDPSLRPLGANAANLDDLPRMVTDLRFARSQVRDVIAASSTFAESTTSRL
jgi:hypothetical protein